jgi:alkylation response protein AidB-like acyl-CoA dehydrogenase
MRTPVRNQSAGRSPRTYGDDSEAFSLSMLAADLLGIMQGAVDAATDYVSSRKQFGVPVGSFQAVQHLAADAKVLLEGTRSAIWYAAWATDALDPAEALLAARQAKAYASSAALEVVEIQIQMLGGIALTWEERSHVRTRRALLDRVTFGDETSQHDAIASSRLGAHT